MSIFDLNSEPDKPTPQEPAGSVKQAEMRKIVGYDSIDDVKRDAPSDYASPRESGSGGRQRATRERSSARTQQQTKREAEAAAKAEKQAKALEVVGKHYAKLLAELPYQFWARFAEDERLNLSKKESTELADSYYLLAQAINPDFTSPWIIALGLVIQNAILVVERFQLLNEDEKLDKMASEAAANMVGPLPEPTEDEDEQ